MGDYMPLKCPECGSKMVYNDKAFVCIDPECSGIIDVEELDE